MRRNFSSPTPLPPYPGSSPAGEAQVFPATAPPSPELPEFGRPAPMRGRDRMRATHIRPRTAPASPERPATGYSTRSTIRQVEPSPDSLSEAFTKGFTDGDTPSSGPASSFEPFPPFDAAQREDTTADDEHGTHIPSTEPPIPMSTLYRGGTPSGCSLPRQSRSCSPQKSRSKSPRKHMIPTPTLSAHKESPSSSYSTDHWVVPDTPSPVPHEQQREACAPLQVRRPFVPANGEGEPAGGQGTQARIAGYMRQMKELQQRRDGPSKVSYADVSSGEAEAPEPARRVVPIIPHIVSVMAQPSDANQALSPFSVAQRQVKQEKIGEKEPARHTSVSRRSEASGASVASRHSIFSTPGRDEMERKKPIVEEDEGPFSKATGMQDLEQKRRRVSEGTRDGDEKRRFCGMRCVMM